MIIDQYYPEPDGRAHLYRRWRDKNGGLIENTITPDDFEPYFWIAADTPTGIVDNTLRRHPGSRIERDKTAISLPRGIDGVEKKLVKVVVNRPGEIGQMRKSFSQTWEADIRFADRYLIDRIFTMPDWKPRVWHFDLEWDPEHDFTTVMAVVDSFNNENVLFCWSRDATMDCEADIRDINGVTYNRYKYKSEAIMHDAFLDYLDECNPDILVAHAIMWADLPHLIRRLKNFRRLSPLNRVRKPPKGKRGYEYTDQPILGRLCFDTAAPAQSGTGFERVWKDSGQPQLASRKLDYITGPDVLDYGGKFDMDVFTGWYERFDEYCDYCMQDTLLLKRMDEENHILDFFLSLQRICGVMFESTHNVTRFARGLLSRRTHWKAPTRSDSDKMEFEGAYVPPPIPGRYENVAILDYKGLYPSLILSHNLSFETQVHPYEYRGEESQKIHKLPDGSCWDQSAKGILPQIVEDMFSLRDGYKQKMKEEADPIKRAGWNTMQMAVKRVMASFYGMTASPGWGWADYDIAGAITSCGREAIKFLLEESTKQGYHPVYGHTDSAFVQVPLTEASALAEHLTNEVQTQLNAKDLVVELETYMPYWLVAGKNLYYGICSWPPEDEGKVKSARFGKISTLAKVSRNIEIDTLNLICKGAGEAEVTEYVRPISLSLLNGTIDLAEVIGITRVHKKLSDYAPSVGVPGVKGARYYNEHIAKSKQVKFDAGDSVQWIYIEGVPEGMPETDIIAFHDIEEIEGFTPNWERMVDRLVVRKIKPIYGAMGWKTDGASGAVMPKAYW
mgnify:CR=1 FL=1